MKKKLLWIGIPSVLIIAVLALMFFYARNGDINQNTRFEQDIQSNQGIMDENIGRTYLSVEECFYENGELNRNPDVDYNGNIVNCYNAYKNKEGKWIYYNNGQVRLEENYKNGKLNGKSIIYDEEGNKMSEGTYINGREDGEHIVYMDGEWWQKFIFENGELLDLQENFEVNEKVSNFYNDRDLRIKTIWDKFTSGDSLNREEFKDLVDFVHNDYDAYYGDDDDDLMKDMYRWEYEDKSWKLIALYAMMNCGGDIENPRTYLFNIYNPQIAQEIYFKNCPKGCKYSNKESIDFVCD